MAAAGEESMGSKKEATGFQKLKSGALMAARR